MGAVAQEAFDLLKYGQYDNAYGTARAQSMSNAVGALGGDVTAVSLNPAGLGVYRKSELEVTFGNSLSAVKSDFAGTQSKDNAQRLTGNSFGYVETFLSDDESGLAAFNFGVAYNRQANFHRNTQLQGTDRPVSLLDNLIDGGDLQEMAYQCYLLDNGRNPVLHQGELTDNGLYLSESGRIDHIDMSMAINYGYFLYLGFTIGVQNITYSLDALYEEAYAQGGSMSLQNLLSTEGEGVDFKFGFIVRPLPFLRLGAAYHSPTFYYNMADSYSSVMYSQGMPDDDGAVSPHSCTGGSGTVCYQYESPSRVVLSGAVQLGRKGFLTGDLQLDDYAGMVERSEAGRRYDDVCRQVSDLFGWGKTWRVGMEWRFNDQLSARAGYSAALSPVNRRVESDNVEVVTPSTMPQYAIGKGRQTASCGLGFHFDSFYLDLAYVCEMHKEHYYPFYNVVETGSGVVGNYANVNAVDNRLAVTLGFRY